MARFATLSQTEENLKRIEDAFHTADQDGNSLLNKTEFQKFVSIAYRKSCPPSMYQSVCTRFNCNPSTGIDLNTAKNLFLTANKGSSSGTSTGSSSAVSPRITSPTSPPMERTSSRVKGKAGSATPSSSREVSYHSIQSSESSSQFSLPRISTSESTSSLNMLEDHEEEACTPRTSERRRLRRMTSTPHRRTRTSTLSLDSNASSNDASSMMVEVLQNKNKNLQSQLATERKRRKKTEEVAQNVLEQNEVLTKETQRQRDMNMKLRMESKTIKDQLRKFKTIIDDDRTTIKHLKQQRNAMKAERDETFSLVTKLEKEHVAALRKLQTKHRQQIEKLTAGFLQSLGVEPDDDRDISTVLKDLKEDNEDLNDRVDILGVSLARKQQSLWEALQAVDNIAMEEQILNEELEQLRSNGDGGSSTTNAIKHKLRRMSLSFQMPRRNSLTLNGMDSDESAAIIATGSGGFIGVSPIDDDEPMTPNSCTSPQDKGDRRRDSEVLTAEFLRNLTGKGSGSSAGYSRMCRPKPKELTLQNAKHMKELEFLSQKLSSDVADKTQSIANLSTANSVLLEQMKRMKVEMDRMHSQLRQDPDRADAPTASAFD